MRIDPKSAKAPLLELDEPGAPAFARGGPRAFGVSTGVDSEVRERMPTVTNEDALEEARLQSLPSNLPPPRRPLSTVPGPMTSGPVTTIPGPMSGNPRDSAVEIDTGEADIDALGDDEQIAILRARLAPVARVPVLAREMAQLGALLEDPKTAYILGFVDGILPLDTIVDVTGLPELDTLRVLDRMVAQSVVIFR